MLPADASSVDDDSADNDPVVRPDYQSHTGPEERALTAGRPRPSGVIHDPL